MSVLSGLWLDSERWDQKFAAASEGPKTVVGTMRISAVVLSFNSAHFLETCIDSLAAAFAENEDQNEIRVIENGSKDASPALLRGLEAKYPGLLHVTYLDHNTGTTASRNLALRQASGRYLLIMDSDVDMPKGTIETLIRRVDSDASCGIAVPRLNYPSGRLQMSTDVFPTLGRKLQRFFALKAMERRANRPPTEPTMVDYAISAVWLFRRDVLDTVGLLDEKIFYSPEDVDYCLRVWAAGYTVVYDPTVHAVHDAQEISRGLFPLRKSTFSHAGGLLYLFRKHGYAFGHKRLYHRLNRFSNGAG